MTWFTIRMVLVLSITNWCIKHQVDFVLYFHQANLEFEMYMKIYQGVETKGESRTIQVLKLPKNIYGQKQGSMVWNQHLAKGLAEI